MGDPFTTAIIITVALAIFVERGKKEYAHTRDRAAAELARVHPDWSPRKVMRHAKRRARGYWWDQISNGFPDYRRAHAETRELAKAERAESEVGWMKRRAELRKRVEDAMREKERLQRGEQERVPDPVTADAKPEAEPTDQIPEVSDQTSEPVKPTPVKPATPKSAPTTTTPANPTGGKEESLYQRYALRRRNGGQPMTAIAIADDLGTTVVEAEELQKAWDARYQRENTSPEPTPREQHDQKVAELADAVPAPERATETQTPNPTTNTTPINGTENHEVTTPNAETTGLQSALAYTEAMAEKSGEGANSVETSIAALEQGEVGGAVTGHLAQAQEHLTAAQAAFQAANEELTQHMNVQEAYNATPDAGNKQFVTAE